MELGRYSKIKLCIRMSNWRYIRTGMKMAQLSKMVFAKRFFMQLSSKSVTCKLEEESVSKLVKTSYKPVETPSQVNQLVMTESGCKIEDYLKAKVLTTHL